MPIALAALPAHAPRSMDNVADSLYHDAINTEKTQGETQRHENGGRQPLQGWRPPPRAALLVAEGLDLGELGLRQLARSVALGDLCALHLLADALDDLRVGEGRHVADVGEV